MHAQNKHNGARTALYHAPPCYPNKSFVVAQFEQIVCSAQNLNMHRLIKNQNIVRVVIAKAPSVQNAISFIDVYLKFNVAVIQYVPASLR